MEPTKPHPGPPGHLKDAALLRLVADRRPEALAELYDRFAPLLLPLARRILGSAPEAEDILQETLIRVWNNPERYDPARSSVSTWLVLLTRSRAIDRLRSRKVVDRTHDAAQLEKPDHASPEAPESVFTQERRERMRQELEKLPAEQRQVIEMAFYEGLSQSEIAARSGIPLGTVKTRTLLAMKKLRAALRDEIRQLL
jgi:RNA polymerase sigma-70 factor (ECF subfamily)